jgi:phosphatidyl-myo-inositol alpha-mannosyltransferase
MFKGGGVQECVFALQSELKRRGHDVKIITPNPRDYEGEAKPDMILVGASTDIKSFHTTAQVSASVSPDAIDSMLAAEQFDILHFHEPWVPVLSRQILSRSTSFNIATFHAKLPDTVMNKTIERVITPYTKSVLKYLHAFTAVSEAAASYISSLTDETIDIIPNGIDLQKYHFREKPTSDDGPVVLFIGRLEKRKGVKYLLRAFAVMQQTEPNAKLLLAGAGPDRDKLEQLVAEYGLRHVQFLGYVDEAKKLELLEQADVFCSPALYGESFGIVLLEALASGLPIVAGSNPGYISVMKGLGRLSVVDPKDTDDFARLLSVMATEAELRAVWRAWAKDYVQQFDYAKIVDGYEALYKRIVA